MNKKYCVYLTTYHGNKLPMFYIGSTSIDRISKGYRGSVKSKQYKDIFNDELLKNPHLFKTMIISYNESREDALQKELKFQKHLNVVKSSMYMNKSFAKDFGWFGMNHGGVNSPVYGKRWKKTPEQCAKIKDVIKARWADPEYAKKISKLRSGKYHRPLNIIKEVADRKQAILCLYKSKPALAHGHKSKNGKIYTYDQAFAVHYSNAFGITYQGIRAIIK
jgi:hypothetical protein